jgi:hypothetical protein
METTTVEELYMDDNGTFSLRTLPEAKDVGDTRSGVVLI